MKNKGSIILIMALIILSGLILYQNIFVFTDTNESNSNKSGEELYTCGMHPDIISKEPGNCPICEMKLTKIKTKGISSGEKKILFWRAPMDPNEIYNSPGKSKMGMDLVPVYDDEGAKEGVVIIDPVVVQNMNVKIEKVIKKRLSSKVVTNGILTTNEGNDFIVTTKVNGWVEKLYINFTGQKVEVGEKLLDIYSPELVAAQQELLTAVAYKKSVGNSGVADIQKSGDELIKNAVRKLQLLGMSDSDINKLKDTKEVKTYVTLYAPKNGTVIHKNITEGQKIMHGMPLLQISDLSTLWLTADIYEYELSKIEFGSSADIKFNFMPGKIVKGKVSFIYPTLDSNTRTAKIRIDIDNKNDLLKPAMLANVTISGKDLGDYPIIPENSILRGGKKDVIILALGEGKFKPQEVILGAYANGYYQVLSGLFEGTGIVTSAQFLIDSESNLKAAVNQFSNSDKTRSEIKKSLAESDMSEMDKKNGLEKRTDYREKNQALQDHLSHDQTKIANMKKEESNSVESIIREGIIDLELIDKNGDGKVFQDLMDWNVISDEPGRCPLCEMKLSEVNLEIAKKNLIENNFQVK